LLSRLQVSTSAAANSPTVINLQGDAHSGQVVRLQQNGLVFFEKQLPEGPFDMGQVHPFVQNTLVSVQLRSPYSPDETVDLPLVPGETRTLFTRRPELMAPVPVDTPQPPTSAQAQPEDDDDIEFETDFLRGQAFRNLDAAAMKKLARVRPGRVDADIYLNNALVTKDSVLFTEPPNSGEARACISAALFIQLGVKPEHISPQGQQLLQNTSATSPTSAKESAACLYIEQWVSGASAKYDNSELLLAISIPQAFLRRQSRTTVPASMLTRGDNAGFVNYSFNHYNSQGQSSDFLNLNSGLNLQGWQVRHTSYLSQNNSATAGSTQQYVAGETFVRRPLIDLKSTLALGELTSQSPIVGSVPLRGLRMASEEGLMSDDERSYRPVVRGVARTNARVRVLQNNAVFFEQTVPPGPFELTEINPPSGVGNLTVTVTEADGSVQSFLLPYSVTTGKLNPGSWRYSLAAGNLRLGTGVTDTPLVQAFLRYGLSNFPTPGLELLTTPQYQSAGLQLAFNNPWGSLALNRLQSQAQGLNGIYANGYSHNINYSAPAFGPVQLFAGMTEQSLGYVSPLSALSATSLDPYNPLSFKNNIFLSLGLNLKDWGSLSLGVVEQNLWADNQQTHQYRLSYNTNIRRMGLSLYVNQTTYANGLPSVDTLGLTATLPLGFLDGTNGLRASHTQTGSAKPTQSLTAYGSALDNKALNYSVTHSRTADLGSSSASLNYQHPWGGVGLSLSGSDDGTAQQSLSASGGVVLHSDGVILSPNVGGTFAIVELPQGEGATVTGSQARINRSGYGVVPNLAPYYLNDVQISLEGASTDLEVGNTSQKVAPVEGSIVRLKFNTSSGRPLLVLLQASSGARIPIGSSVSDEQGNDVGTVGQGSRVLVRVKKPTGRLKVVWGDKPEQTCLSDYSLGEGQNAGVSGFTLLKLNCQVEGSPPPAPAPTNNVVKANNE
jgi:outer membrane usher protein